jgi:thioredoxin 1
METVSGQIELSSLINSAPVVVLDIFAEWCGPCKVLSPILESIQIEMESSGVKIYKVDATTEPPSFVEEMGIRNVPTLLFYKNGELVKTEVGARPKLVIQKIIDELCSIKGETGEKEN